MSESPFLDALASAEPTAGVYLFHGFVSPSEADELFALLNDDSNFPWDTKPVLYGERLTQHAYEYVRGKQHLIKKWAGLARLETLCERIEQHFDGKIPVVFCNRFQDPAHALQWHTDTYGQHIFVLSVGSGAIPRTPPHVLVPRDTEIGSVYS